MQYLSLSIGFCCGMVDTQPTVLKLTLDHILTSVERRTCNMTRKSFVPARWRICERRSGTSRAHRPPCVTHSHPMPPTARPSAHRTHTPPPSPRPRAAPLRSQRQTQQPARCWRNARGSSRQSQRSRDRRSTRPRQAGTRRPVTIFGARR